MSSNSNEIDLIGLNFEEGNGSTVNDQTLNGNNGTINGAALQFRCAKC